MSKKRGKVKRKSVKNKSSRFNKLYLARVYPVAIRLLLFFSVVFVAVPLLIRSLNYNAPLSANTTYTLYFAILVISLFVYFTWTKIINFKWPKIHKFDTFLFGGVAFIFLVLHFAAKFSVSSNFAVTFPTIYFAFSGFLYLMLAFFTALTIFGSEFMLAFYRELIVLVSIVIPYFSITLFMRSQWHVFSSALVKINAVLIKIVFYNIPDLALSYTFNGDPTFELEGFKVIIGSPCSGIESIVLFAGFFIFIGILDWSKLSHLKLFALFPIGVAGMFAMSVLRIFLLMVVGAFYSPTLALSLFHTNVGWVLFVGYFFIFMLFAYPFMKVKKKF